jgi:guanylate kinase
MSKKQFSIGLDYDDVLAHCNSYSLDVLNEKHSTNYTINDINSWDESSVYYEERLALYHDPDFVKNQPLIEGAKEFVHKLSKIANVYIVSAVFPECMSERAMRILKDFPDIKPENIILGASKEIYNLDFILDDSPSNIKKSNARFPVLMRRPWNDELSGLLSVNSYEDFLHIVEIIGNSYVSSPDLVNGGVICLVGPSGSGKTADMTELIKDSNFVKPITTTTRQKRDNEADDAYRFISKESFISEKEAGKFLETTTYSNNFYGTSADQIDSIILQNKYAVIPIDICGAITIKNLYRDKAILVFVKRSRKDVISEILDRNCSNEEKMSRIISLDNEYKNDVFCDAVLNNNKTLEQAAENIKKIIAS